MSAIKDGGSAFPVSNEYYPNGGVEYGQPGMSLRDWFAGMALQGEIASSSTELSCESTAKAAADAGRSIEDHIARGCYSLADAMIAARDGKEGA